jgi:TetR/AcrR family transcriptional regulator, fatty acid metabolism regulator protein
MSLSQEPTLRDLRRGQIIAVARKIVAEEGLESLTIGALEDRLSFSRGVITYHFRNKEEIVEELLDSAISDIDSVTRAAVSASATPADMIRSILRANVQGFLERRDASRILLAFWGRIWSDKHARDLNARLYSKYRELARKTVELGMKSGTFATVDAQAMSVHLVGLVIGIVTQELFEPGAVDVDRAVDEAAKTILARLMP